MNHEIMRGNNYAAQICIDGYDSKILCGRLQSAALDSEMSFGSLMEFFCEMEQLLDQTLPMQAFTERRTFPLRPVRPAAAVCHDADARPARYLYRAHPVPAERQLAGLGRLGRGQTGGALPQRTRACSADGQRPHRTEMRLS